MAAAGIPHSAALVASLSILQAPSRRLYMLWLWRCTNSATVRFSECDGWTGLIQESKRRLGKAGNIRRRRGKTRYARAPVARRVRKSQSGIILLPAQPKVKRQIDRLACQKPPGTDYGNDGHERRRCQENGPAKAGNQDLSQHLIARIAENYTDSAARRSRFRGAFFN